MIDSHDRETVPPTLDDARALVLSASHLGPWKHEARGVYARLKGQRDDLPEESAAWLRELAEQGNRRGELARKLLDELGGAS